MMFQSAKGFNGDISKWKNTLHIGTMERMFYDARSLYQDLSGWKIQDKAPKSEMFGKTPMEFEENMQPQRV